MLQEGRFAEAQKSRFLAANVSNMGIAVLQRGSISYFTEIAFQSVKRTDMCSEMLQQVRFTDDHELRLECSKNFDMYSDYMKRIHLLMLRNRVFWIGNYHI